jgi:hypothetical protein
MLDFSARTIQAQSAPENAGTKHLGRFSPESFLGLDRQADGYVAFAVEDLKKVIAQQAPEIALWPRPGSQLNAAVTSMAFRTDDIGSLHSPTNALRN